MPNESLPRKYRKKSSIEKSLEKTFNEFYLWIKDFRKQPKNMSQTAFKLGELIIALVLLYNLGFFGSLLAVIGVIGLNLVFR